MGRWEQPCPLLSLPADPFHKAKRPKVNSSNTCQHSTTLTSTDILPVESKRWPPRWTSKATQASDHFSMWQTQPFLQKSFGEASSSLLFHKLQTILSFLFFSLRVPLAVFVHIHVCIVWREKPRCLFGWQHCAHLIYSLVYPLCLSDFGSRKDSVCLFLETVKVSRKPSLLQNAKLLATKVTKRFLKSAWTKTSQPPGFQTSFLWENFFKEPTRPPVLHSK